MEKLLSIQEVCEYLKVSRSLVYKWVHYRQIPHIKIGTRVRFSPTYLERWLKVRMRKLKRIQLEI